MLVSFICFIYYRAAIFIMYMNNVTELSNFFLINVCMGKMIDGIALIDTMSRQ